MRAAAFFLDADAGPDDQHAITKPQRRSYTVAQHLAQPVAITIGDALSDRDADAAP